MGNVSAAVGHAAHRHLEVATKRATVEMQAGLSSDPEQLIFIVGNYDKGKKQYENALAFLKNTFGPEIPMLGMNSMGTFTQSGYSLRGVAIMGLQGVAVDPIRVPRIRIRSKQKGQRIAKFFKKQTLPQEKSVSVHFPPGIVFPKFMIEKMIAQKPTKFFAGFNLPPVYWFSGLMRRMGKLTGKLFDLTGLGMPYTGTWNAFVEMHKAGLNFIGANGANVLDMSHSFQFHNYKIFKKSMVSFQLRSKDLQFGTGIECAANTTDKECNIQDYLPGGFATKINNKWGRDAVFELNNNPSPELWYHHYQDFQFMDLVHPFCIEDPEEEIGDSARIYCLGANPQFRAALHTAPDQVLERIRKKKIRAVMGYQSGEQLIDFIGKSLSNIKEQAGITKPKFAFLFDCINCLMALSHRFKAIPAQIREVLDDTPYLGIIACGEIISNPYPLANMSVVSLIAGS